MHDLRWIRDNSDAFDAALGRRNKAPGAAQILAVDEARRAIQTALQEMQERRNGASKEIGRAMGEGRTGEVAALKEEVAALKGSLRDAEERERALSSELNELLMELPNILADDVPDGDDESANQELRRVGDPPAFDFEPREHFDLGEALGLMDFETAAKISGSRFVILKGGLARLERALAQFMLDIHTAEFGYLEVSPPLLVREETLFGVGQLPKMAEDMFKTEEGHWMIPTAEVSLVGMAMGDIIDEASLPIRYVAHTACFRSEAGASGKDTRGMVRTHQFYKVELVSLTHPDQSDAEHERMTGCAEAILQRLGLAYRVVVLASGDTGFNARRTFDIEVWLPGQGQYREISSCSNVGPFQARRMNGRFRPIGVDGSGGKDGKPGKPEFLHTLNGSGLAIGRTLIAVMENNQRADGTIAVPEVLQPYMGGVTVLGAGQPGE